MKQLFILISAGCLGAATACNNPQQQPTPATDSAHTTAGEQVVRQLFDAFNRHDWTQMAACYADTALFLDPSFGKEYVTKTRQQTIAKYTEMAAMFPDIKDDVKAVYAAGDHVTVEFVSSGSSAQTGAWQLPICTVFTLQQGKIIKDATYYDQE